MKWKLCFSYMFLWFYFMVLWIFRYLPCIFFLCFFFYFFAFFRENPRHKRIQVSKFLLFYKENVLKPIKKITWQQLQWVSYEVRLYTKNRGYISKKYSIPLFSTLVPYSFCLVGIGLEWAKYRQKNII